MNTKWQWRLLSKTFSPEICYLDACLWKGQITTGRLMKVRWDLLGKALAFWEGRIWAQTETVPCFPEPELCLVPKLVPWWLLCNTAQASKGNRPHRVCGDVLGPRKAPGDTHICFSRSLWGFTLWTNVSRTPLYSVKKRPGMSPVSTLLINLK